MFPSGSSSATFLSSHRGVRLLGSTGLQLGQKLTLQLGRVGLQVGHDFKNAAAGIGRLLVGYAIQLHHGLPQERWCQSGVDVQHQRRLQGIPTPFGEEELQIALALCLALKDAAKHERDAKGLIGTSFDVAELHALLEDRFQRVNLTRSSFRQLRCAHLKADLQLRKVSQLPQELHVRPGRGSLALAPLGVLRQRAKDEPLLRPVYPPDNANANVILLRRSSRGGLGLLGSAVRREAAFQLRFGAVEAQPVQRLLDRSIARFEGLPHLRLWEAQGFREVAKGRRVAHGLVLGILQRRDHQLLVALGDLRGRRADFWRKASLLYAGHDPAQLGLL
eukprot:scaffold721_cov235-Pinguiococcus_pyrenoidosus.AAC.8